MHMYFFKSFARILSGPVALTSLSEIRTSCISSAVTKMSEIVTLGVSVYRVVRFTVFIAWKRVFEN